MYDSKKTLLLATHNPAKYYEIKELLAGIKYEIISLTDLGITYDVPETGTTFEENALLKAKEYAALSGLITLADDSGLEVDALGGEPGVYSNRYAGEAATDEQKCEFLLAKMRDVPPDQRQAHFTVVMALVYPWGKVSVHKGYLYGMITTELRGAMVKKFPYRTVFLLPDYGKTIAQLQEEGVDIQAISPRTEVVMKVKRELISF